MVTAQIDDSVLKSIDGKTVIITGAAGGIGAHVVRQFAAHGANVVAVDLEYARSPAEALIASLPDPARAIFVATNIVNWAEMKNMFKQAVSKFGSIEMVIANAGVMESKNGFELNDVDENGDLVEATELSRVIDINLKGTLNTLRLGMFFMKENKPCFPDGKRGSILLNISFSGYFGATGVAGYIASKHGITGLLRASQIHAAKYGIRVNGVAPFFTPSDMSKAFADEWNARGLQKNTQEGLAAFMAKLTADHTKSGTCFLACGAVLQELEDSRKAMITQWLGEGAADLMAKAGQLFVDIGGYPYPKLAAMAATDK